MSRARPSTGRRNTAVAAATGVLTGLLFLYPTSLGHSTGTAALPAVPVPASSNAPAVDTTPAAPATATVPVAANNGTATTTRTVTGQAAQTRYGPVQVQLTLSGNRIVDAQAVEYPTESGRDRRINQVAVPELNRMTVAAQSAGIDTVSGATYTSDGYVQSLQSALDAAHLTK